MTRLPPSPSEPHRRSNHGAMQARYWERPSTPGVAHPRFSDWGLLTFKGPFRFAPHLHHHYEVITVEAGKYRCLLGGTSWTLEAGDFLLVKPGDRHEDFCDRGLRYASLRFTLSRPGEEDSWNIFSPSAQAHHQVFRRHGAGFAELFSRISRESASHAPFAHAILDALTADFFWSALRLIAPQALEEGFRNTTGEQGFRMRLLGLFQRHLGGSLSIAAMARAMGLPERTFTLYCRRLMGDSPARVYARFRLERARELLGEGMSVRSTADALGFSNPYHFSRAYKACFGVPPSTARGILPKKMSPVPSQASSQRTSPPRA